MRLNALAPGVTDTPLVQSGLDDPEVEQGIRAFPIPIGRFAEPSEIAAAIAFLLGPEASADKSLGIQSWRHMPYFNGMKIYKPIVFAVNGPVHWGGDAARQHARGLRRRGYFGLLELRWGIGQGGAPAAQMRWDLPWRIAMDMVLRGGGGGAAGGAAGGARMRPSATASLPRSRSLTSSPAPRCARARARSSPTPPSTTR